MRRKKDIEKSKSKHFSALLQTNKKHSSSDFFMKLAKVCISVLLIFTITTPHPILAAAFTLSFSANGGDYASTPASQVVEEGATIDLTAISQPTRTGYSFSGWEYDGAVVTTLTMPTKNVVLLAKWQAMEEPISFDVLLTNVQNAPADFTLPVDAILDLGTLSIPTHTRYTFVGWKVNGKLIASKIKVPAGGLMLEATWKGSAETLEFDVNGGEENSKPETVQEPIGALIQIGNIPEPKRKGYTFMGWMLDGKRVASIYKMCEGTTTLIAEWHISQDGFTLDTLYDSIDVEATETTDVPIIEYFGATAQDVIDGDLTSHIVYTGTIKFDVVGTYTLRLHILNSRGQTLSKVVTVHIIDTTPPEIISFVADKNTMIGDPALNDLITLFELKTHDVVSKDKNKIEVHVPNDFQMYTSGTFNIEFTITDTYNNSRIETGTLHLLPATVSGQIFLDANYDHLNNDKTVYSKGIIIEMIHPETKEVLAWTTSTNTGDYIIETPAAKIVENFQLRVQIPQALTLANQNVDSTTMHSSVDPTTGMSRSIEISGQKIEHINIGVAPNIKRSISKRKVTTNVGESNKIDIKRTKGTIGEIIIENDALVQVEKVPSGIKVAGLQPGKTKIKIHYTDNYGRTTNIVDEVLIEVK